MKSIVIKKIRILSISAVALTFVLLTVTSCKKNVVSNPNTNMAAFYFHFYPYIDSTPLTDTAALYRDSAGRYFGISTAQMLIYNVVLYNTSGVGYAVPDAYMITDLDSGKYLIGYAPAGTYNAVSFTVGLDAGTNTLAPSVFVPVGYISTYSMLYPGPQGYMSVLINGFADTTSAVTDSGYTYFQYEIGSQAYPEHVTLPVRTGALYPVYTAVANGTDTISIIADYGKLLSGVNFKVHSQDTTDTYTTNTALAPVIANNIPNMFRYKN